VPICACAQVNFPAQVEVRFSNYCQVFHTKIDVLSDVDCVRRCSGCRLDHENKLEAAVNEDRRGDHHVIRLLSVPALHFRKSMFERSATQDSVKCTWVCINNGPSLSFVFPILSHPLLRSTSSPSPVIYNGPHRCSFFPAWQRCYR
jgi:hypothetical protein